MKTRIIGTLVVAAAIVATYLLTSPLDFSSTPSQHQQPSAPASGGLKATKFN